MDGILMLSARSKLRVKITAAALAMASVASASAADVGKGADSFDANCAECHSVAKTLRNKKGPSLFGIVGRKSASIAGADYSDAMKASGIVWTTDKLEAYITAPKTVVPGGTMKFKGLPDAAERADLIAFLSAQK
jgi:cytochrome c